MITSAGARLKALHAPRQVHLTKWTFSVKPAVQQTLKRSAVPNVGQRRKVGQLNERAATGTGGQDRELLIDRQRNGVSDHVTFSAAVTNPLRYRNPRTARTFCFCVGDGPTLTPMMRSPFKLQVE